MPGAMLTWICSTSLTSSCTSCCSRWYRCWGVSLAPRPSPSCGERNRFGGQAEVHKTPVAPGTQGRGEGDLDAGTSRCLPYLCKKAQKGIDEEEQVHETLNRQAGATSCLWALVLIWDFRDVCWKDNTAGYKQPRRLLSAPARRGSLLELIFTNKVLVGDVAVQGSLGCSDHERVEFRVLSVGRRGLTALGFRKADWCLQRSAWRSPLGSGNEGKRGPRKMVDVQRSPPPSSRALHPNKWAIRQKSHKATWVNRSF